ncbi:MAG: zinc metalloprotease HtpX [Nitratireductor sp.]
MSRQSNLDIVQQQRSRALNTLHTWLLAAGSLSILAASAWAFGGMAALVYALLVGAVSMMAMRRISPRLVLSMYKARPVSRAQFAKGIAVLEELARRAGLPKAPVLHVVPSRLMNAFAVGRREDSAIAVTDALMRQMTLRELTAILAHEISHIAHEDVKVMALADMVSRFTSVLSTVGLLSLVLNLLVFAGGYQAQVPWLAVFVLLAAPTVGGLLQMALSRTREYDADLGAAMLTGDPEGLASALVKLERAQGRLWESLLLPGGRIPDPSVLRTHPPTEERVRRLMALKGARALPHEDVPVHAGGRARQRRASFIPAIGRHRRPDAATYRHLAGLMPGAAVVTEEEAAHPAPATALGDPAGRPRIRIRRGGVWW